MHHISKLEIKNVVFAAVKYLGFRLEWEGRKVRTKK